MSQFDSAIIGNSTAQMLKPAELSQSDRLALRAALCDRRQSRASSSPWWIFSCATMRASARWCSLLTPGGAPIIQSNRRLARFRIWLYGDSTLAYAARLFSWRAIEHAFQRLSIGLGRRKRMDPDGFFGYEDIWLPGQFRATNPPRDPVPAATAAGRRNLSRHRAAR